jgi:DNA adenine methylase
VTGATTTIKDRPRAPRRQQTRPVPRPVLKWAGGKGQLLHELVARLPRPFKGYHEPFVGGGALFFELFRSERLQRATLTDVNPALVDVYLAVRDQLDEVIALLLERKNDEDEYYKVRAWDPAELSLPERAARVIYMNKTGYNGLYRENSKGKFNVPFGRYVNPNICDEPNLRAASSALAGVEIAVRDFRDVLTHAASGDLVYFDPPYLPRSETSSFTAYAKGGFGLSDQYALRDVARALVEAGVHVLLSNSDTETIHDMYREFKGFEIDVVQATRAINSKASGRGKIGEVIVRG